MIKVSGKSAVRECTARYIDPETRDEGKHKVEYYSHTPAQTRQWVEDAAKEDAEYEKKIAEHAEKVAKAKKEKKPAPPPLPRRLLSFSVRSLAQFVHGLPELGNAKGEPYIVPPGTPDVKRREIMGGYLETLTQENLDLIEKAIKEDVEGKK